MRPVFCIPSDERVRTLDTKKAGGASAPPAFHDAVRILLSAAVAAAPCTATTVAATTATLLARFGLVDGQGAAIAIFFVQLCHGGARRVVVRHLDETEALAPACVAILDHLPAAPNQRERKAPPAMSCSRRSLNCRRRASFPRYVLHAKTVDQKRFRVGAEVAENGGLPSGRGEGRRRFCENHSNVVKPTASTIATFRPADRVIPLKRAITGRFHVLAAAEYESAFSAAGPSTSTPPRSVGPYPRRTACRKDRSFANVRLCAKCRCPER